MDVLGNPTLWANHRVKSTSIFILPSPPASALQEVNLTIDGTILALRGCQNLTSYNPDLVKGTFARPSLCQAGL